MPLPAWTPDLPALDLLLSVAESGSVGRAAEQHRISQPSASARLTRLERRLGVPLLIRGARGTRLTPAGEAVVAWARTVVAAAEALTDGVATLRSDRGARLTVAASLTVAEYLLPGWLLTLRRRHPGAEVAVSVANSLEVCQRVAEGRADLGFVETPAVPPALTSARVGTDRLGLLVAPGYPLAARADSGVRAVDVLDLPLLVREPGSGTRDTLLHALAEALGEPDVPLLYAVELGSTTTILATARAGGGVAVVSTRAAAADLAAGSLVEVAVPALELARPLHAVWLGRQPSELGAELIRVGQGPA